MNISKEKFDELTRIGWLMANVCYSLSQSNIKLTTEERLRVGELVRQWDAADHSTKSVRVARSVQRGLTSQGAR